MDLKPRSVLAPGLEASRIVTGLWQVADQERAHGPLDCEHAADALVEYANAGFDSFDMADHYGSAELIAARAREKLLEHRVNAESGESTARFFTKWCPAPGSMTAEVVRAGIAERAARLGVETIDLLQLHWWTFEHPGYLDAMEGLALAREEGRIRHIGVTNFDTDHLHVLIEEGYRVATNQVCVSLLDRRGLGEMSRYCVANDVKLLAYGTLAGGFLSERWLGLAAPTAAELGDWSKMKYKRFIDTAGGWPAFQRLLEALAGVAARKRVSIANVATRWVMEQPAVGAIVVGARLNEREHRADNLAVYGFDLDDDDRARIDEALLDLQPLPGDCGREYRQPPYLTASGDLSHHLDTLPKAYEAKPVAGRPDRLQVDTGSEWESICGYCRALRVGDRILVSGTTATHGRDRVICKDDARGQAVYVLDKIAAGISALGGTLEDVVRTRIYLQNAHDWEAVSRVHGRYFDTVRPANTLMETGRLIGDYLVEIEAEAVI